MERHEIIEAFNEWAIPVNLRDLEHPTSEFVAMIYSACLQRVRSLSQSDLEQPLQTALAQIDNHVCLAAIYLPSRSSILDRICMPLRSPILSYSTICRFNCAAK
jgi:hypothetical protein